MTTIKLSDGDLGDEYMLVRCNLAEASAPVLVDYCAEGQHKWEPTPYQCADARHKTEDLAELARGLAAKAIEVSISDFACDTLIDDESIGRDLWSATRPGDRRALAETHGDVEGWPVCECPCDCGEPATTTDDNGQPVCDECETYIATDDGEVICSRQTDGFTCCHVCGATIRWGGIETHDSGSGRPNYRRGDCDCGEDAWLDEDRGGWGHYSYGVEDHDEETAG